MPNAPNSLPPNSLPRRDPEPHPIESTSLTFYPAYIHRSSPVYFSWVKLTCHDIHNTLQPHKGFSAGNDHLQQWGHRDQQLLLFYLNHPIQFVALVGVIVAFEDYFDKFWLFTIDDSSGATVEVKCRKPVQANGQVDERDKARGKDHGDSHALHGQSSVGNTTTNKDNLDASGNPKHATSNVDAEESARTETMSKIDVGVVVHVKGTITTFRETRQIYLERITVVPDTNAEMRFRESLVTLRCRVLSHPWIIPAGKQRELLDEARREAEGDMGRERRQAERHARRKRREERDTEKIGRHFEKEARLRDRGAEKAREEGRRLLARTS